MMKFLMLSALSLLAACGTKDGPSFQVTINYGSKTFADTFGKANLSDVVVLAINEGEPIYDPNGDGTADNIVFPEQCAKPPLLEKNCGFTRESVQSEITISGLPLGYSWHLELRGRDVTGATLFTGLGPTFKNENGAAVPPIVIQ